MDKHTPGPWMLWGDAGPAKVIGHGGGFVAQTLDGNDVANARLIAAAPDLLAALQAYEEARKYGSGTKWEAVDAQVRAAIAKATQP